MEGVVTTSMEEAADGFIAVDIDVVEDSGRFPKIGSLVVEDNADGFIGVDIDALEDTGRFPKAGSLAVEDNEDGFFVYNI